MECVSALLVHQNQCNYQLEELSKGRYFCASNVSRYLYFTVLLTLLFCLHTGLRLPATLCVDLTTMDFPGSFQLRSLQAKVRFNAI